MKNTSESSTALGAAHHKATLIGRLLERHGVKLSRAQQLEALAYVEGAASWHALAADLKVQDMAGQRVGVYAAKGLQTWRVEIVPLEDNGGSLVIDEERIDSLSEQAKLQVIKHLGLINRCFDPEQTLVAMVDGQLGMLVEQEFESREADGDCCEETEAHCIERLRAHLLPRVEPLLKDIPGARMAVVTDSHLVWNGRPTFWAFLPITKVTPAHCTSVCEAVAEFAYPQEVDN